MHRRREQSPDTTLSKNLSWILRHGAKPEGLNINSDGFIDVNLILSHKNFSSKKCRLVDIIRVVEKDKKNRYTLKKCEDTGELWIKANQGHSMPEVNDLSLQKVTSPLQIPTVVHGTFLKNWAKIKIEGLKQMNRNHIHFSMGDAFKSTSNLPISGFRSTCEVLVYIDAPKAMAAGIEFFISENNVILSSGHCGIINPEFFLKAIERRTGKLLEF